MSRCAIHFISAYIFCLNMCFQFAEHTENILLRRRGYSDILVTEPYFAVVDKVVMYKAFDKFFLNIRSEEYHDSCFFA